MDLDREIEEVGTEDVAADTRTDIERMKLKATLHFPLEYDALLEEHGDFAWARLEFCERLRGHGLPQTTIDQMAFRFKRGTVTVEVHYGDHLDDALGHFPWEEMQISGVAPVVGPPPQDDGSTLQDSHQQK